MTGRHCDICFRPIPDESALPFDYCIPCGDGQNKLRAWRKWAKRKLKQLKPLFKHEKASEKP